VLERLDFVDVWWPDFGRVFPYTRGATEMDQPTVQAISAVVYLLAKTAKASDCDIDALRAQLAAELAGLRPPWRDSPAAVVVQKFVQMLQKNAPSPLKH
jgi:hypothetical protein